MIAGFNMAAEEVLRLSRSDIGRALGDMPLLAGSPRLEQQCSEVIAGGEESRADSRDGDRWFVVRVSPYRRGGRGVAGTDADVHERDRVPREHRSAIDERECTKAILNTVAEALVVLSADQRIQSGNRAFYTSSGSHATRRKGPRSTTSGTAI